MSNPVKPQAPVNARLNDPRSTSSRPAPRVVDVLGLRGTRPGK
jgi:hypothetical protein